MFKIKLPPIDLRHLKTLTDETGIIHHTIFSIPERKEGYTTDDNARALMVCVKYLTLFDDSKIEELVGTYLSFLLFMQRPDGKIHNLLSYDRCFIEEEGSEDSLGRTLMACGYTVNSNVNEEHKSLAKQIFDKALPWALKFTSPRSKAFAIIGLNQYKKAFPKDQNINPNIRLLGRHIIELYKDTSTKNWKWYEPYLTYENAKLPHAMFDIYETLKDYTSLTIAEESFNFLIDIQIKDGTFYPIGNEGWFMKGGKRALYDQQPIEAASTVETAVKGLEIIGEEKYERTAEIVFDWYLGNNSKKIAVYDSKSATCYDGLTPEGLNRNQGAESITTYLIARLALERIKEKKNH